MASASSSQSTLRLGRSKKSPTVMDQIGKFFGGEKKKKGKVRIEQAFLQLLFCALQFSFHYQINTNSVRFLMTLIFHLKVYCVPNLLLYSISSIE